MLVRPRIVARLDLEPVLSAIDFRYVPESRILTAAVYDENQDRIVQKMHYAFTLNETRTREGPEPFYALGNEWGVFGLSVRLGGQELRAQNVVQVGNLVRPQTRALKGVEGSGPILEPGNPALHPGLRLKSMHRQKFREVTPEPHEISQKKTYPRDYVAEEFWQPPPHPYAPIFDYQTNKVFDQYMLTVVFYFDPYQVEAYVVNERRDGSFWLSETVPETFWEQDEREAVFMFEFQPTDIGQYPYLLIDCWDLQFLVPLTTQPVQPNGTSEDFTYFLQYYFQCPVTVLGLSSGNVTNGWFLQTPRVRIVSDKMEDVVNAGGALTILPTSLI